MRRLSTLFFMVASFAAGLAVAPAPSLSATADAGDQTYRKLAIFARVLNYVQNNYVTPVEPELLVYGAIRGLLATLDPHSSFMDPEQFAAVRSETQGEFGGIGVEVVIREGRMVVVARYDGSPAHRAGLAMGDTIVAVDGAPTKGMQLTEAVRRIKGAPGTPVVLSVVRAKGGAAVELRLVRDRIQVASVDARRLEGFGYLKIRAFSERTAHDVARGLAQLREEGPISGLVLDLRDNPGGLLDQAVRVADLWIEEGVIVSTEGRQRTPDVERAHPKGTEPGYPIVALVNGGTASAAEIVAGALQDHGRARVLGTQSFGKGSVQTVIELEDQSALKLTIARYYTPKHRSIQGTGITPDMVVPLAALEMPEPPQGDVPVRGAPAPGDDNQLAAALSELARLADRRPR